MKKFVAMLLAICLVLSCAGCSAVQTPAAPEVEHEEQPAASAAPVEEKKAYSHGKWRGWVFESEYAGIELVLANEKDEWEILKDAELTEMMGLDAGKIQNAKDFEKAVAKENNIVDMMFLHKTNGSSMQLMYENISLSEDAAGLTAEAYTDLLQAGLVDNEEIRFELLKRDTVKRCGKEFIRLKLFAEEYGAYQHYLVAHEGDMMTIIVLTALSEQGIADMMMFFKK